MDKSISSDGKRQASLQDDISTQGRSKSLLKSQSEQSGWRNQYSNYSDAQLQKMLASEYKDISDNELEKMLRNINGIDNKNKMFKPLKAGRAISPEDEVQNIEAELELRREIAARRNRPKGGSGSTL